MIRLLDGEVVAVLQVFLKTRLFAAMKSHELVDVTGVRQIGKSHVLSEFGKKLGIPVVVACKRDKEYYMQTLNYGNVYTVDELRGSNVKKVLIDAYVNPVDVENLGIEVVTGYCVGNVSYAGGLS